MVTTFLLSFSVPLDIPPVVFGFFVFLLSGWDKISKNPISFYVWNIHNIMGLIGQLTPLYISQLAPNHFLVFNHVP